MIDKIPAMRGIKEAVAEIRRADPETAVTEHYLRGLIKSGALPHRQAGRKIIISMDALYTYLSGEEDREELDRIERNGVIRSVSEWI